MTYTFNQTHYYLLMYLKPLEKTCQKEYQLDPAHFVSAPGLAWQACLKLSDAKHELLTDENMLLMVEEGTRGGICQAIHHYETANKYMKDYNKNVISSFLECLNANNLYGWAMRKKLPIEKIRWAKKLSVYTEQAMKIMTMVQYLKYMLSILQWHVLDIKTCHF